MAEPEQVSDTARCMAARVKRSLEKEHKPAQELQSEHIPDTVQELSSHVRHCRDITETARDYLNRFENHVSELESALIKQRIPAADIADEIDILADYSLDCVRWIKKIDNIALQCQELRAELTSIPGSTATSRYSSVSALGDSMQNLGTQAGSQTSQITPIGTPSADQREPTPHKSAAAFTNAAKLPKLELMKFKGEPSNWRPFWDTFNSSIHQNPNLNPVDKMKYLRSLLSDEAEKVIAGLPLANEHYESAVALLQNQYANPDTQIADIHAKLMQLKSVPNETKRLRSFYLEVESSLRSLEALSQVTENPHFVSLILSKLPPPLILLLERSKGPKTPWSVQVLRDSLNSEISIREASDRFRAKPEAEKDPPQPKGSPDKNPACPPATGFALPASENGAKPERRLFTNPTCLFCRKQHWSDECPEYSTVSARKNQIRGRCFICLSDKHRQRECPVQRPCFHCQEVGKHHRSLCIKKFPTGERQGPPPNTSSNVASDDSNQSQGSSLNPNAPAFPAAGPPQTGATANLAMGEKVFMQTAECEIQNLTTKQRTLVRLLFDNASNRSYTTDNITKKLNLPVKPGETLHVSRFADTKVLAVPTKSTEFGIVLQSGAVKPITANVIPHVTSGLSNGPIPSQIISRLPLGIKLAESPYVGHDSPIDLLVGSDFFWEFITGGRKDLGDGIFLVESLVGWMFSGRLAAAPFGFQAPTATMFAISEPCFETNVVSTIYPDKAVLKASWEDMRKLETIGIHEDPYLDDDDLAVQQFQSSVSEDGGRYSVSWPKKANVCDLPSNYPLSVGRLHSLMKRLSDKPELLKKYQAILSDQIEKGVIEKVDPPSKAEKVHYLPHHPVETPLKTTTKVRIVYDASARAGKRKPSLNHCLLRGPVILQDLVTLLIRFRIKEIAVIADIEKAFLQVGLNPKDRDLTRFLWLKDANKSVHSENLQEYRFARVPFGMTSSPFLLGATVKHHLQKESEKTVTAAKIRDNLYVDNVIVGAASVAEAKEIYHDGKEIFQKARMNLREWITNSPKVNSLIPAADRADSGTIKVLGLVWNNQSDTVTVQIPSQPTNAPITKRIVLCFIAAVFDPLGLFAPVTVAGKIFFQSLCKQKRGWDDEIGASEAEIWDNLVKGIQNIPNVKVSRFIGNPDSAKTTILACFADASTKGYATVIYLLIQSKDGTWDSNFLFSRARMNPIKPVTVPRLELLAVLIGARAIRYIKGKVPIPCKSYIWTDSKCVLSWLNSDKMLKNFVSRRVEEIKSVESTVQYVKTAENPADIATRESGIVSEMWFKGPDWLRSGPKAWATAPMSEEPAVNEMETIESEYLKHWKTGEASLLASSAVLINTPYGIDPTRYSDLSRLLRVTALCTRFVQGMKKNRTSSSWLSAKEIADAKITWIKYTQETAFLELLRAFKYEDEHPLMHQLGVKLDHEGIIRCHGRLLHSDLQQDAKFPILLPKQHWFTTLVIRHCHALTMHAGVKQTLVESRKEVWIVQGRREISRVLKKCTVCKRWNAGPYRLPNMPDLPFFRVTKNQPFQYTGLDYFGPLYIKGDTTSKVWGCLFTCLTVRAVHLELVTDMTSEQFLLALRRFIARRRVPAMILSDNAPQFKQVDSVVNYEAVRSFMSKRGIDWSYITAYAPWMGGVYERMIQIVKKPLRKALGRTSLTYQQLETLLTEIEFMVNSRPLTSEEDVPGELFTLTPSHFLGFPPCSISTTPKETQSTEIQEPTSKTLISMFKKTQNCLDQFWKIWKTEYLQYLREKSKWFHRNPRITCKAQPQVGDVVLVKNEMLSRVAWQLAKISELSAGTDGQIRTAKVILPTKNEVRRSIGQLYPLELSSRTPA